MCHNDLGQLCVSIVQFGLKENSYRIISFLFKNKNKKIKRFNLKLRTWKKYQNLR